MAETPSKRPREETQLIEDSEDPKRHKSYTQILSLLEEEEEREEPNQSDFSSILTTFQRELSCDSTTFDDPLSLPADPDQDSGSSDPSPTQPEEDEDDDERERVMRRLLEASDDELGIPNRVMDGGDGDGEVIDGVDEFALCDRWWELEDEAANYYTLLQSELFM